MIDILENDLKNEYDYTILQGYLLRNSSSLMHKHLKDIENELSQSMKILQLRTVIYDENEVFTKTNYKYPFERRKNVVPSVPDIRDSIDKNYKTFVQT